jgi:hypothetical protein
MAYQLASFDSRIRAKIEDAIEDEPMVVNSCLRVQFQKLLVQPLSFVAEIRREQPIVVVLDALDECGRIQDRKELVGLLSRESARLPSALRFIFLSRKEFDIQRAFEGRSHVFSQELDITSSANHHDIQSFFRHRMSAVREDYDILALSLGWPGEETFRTLTERAAGLFIWASTASAFVEDGHDPRKRLCVLLQAETTSDAASALDALYTTALRSAGKWDDPDFGSDFRAILGLILVAKSPLSHKAIDELLHTDKDRPSILTISRLGCVLTQSPTVRILHPSFADFLSDRVRCGTDAWFIDPEAHSHNVAIGCLSLLQRTLKRNLCGLVLSRGVVDASLHEHVAYACLFWIDHIDGIADDISSIANHLNQFIFQHLLHWLEAMSILRKSRETIGMLNQLLAWVTVSCRPFEFGHNPNSLLR